ncbi:class D beta-lactamase [Shewanella waksmanii]|uniref:class D beta-lactamase n=1 Tax=Shewanella waksmanii TaxID=213783 RepID=UPI003736B1AA
MKVAAWLSGLLVAFSAVFGLGAAELNYSSELEKVFTDRQASGVVVLFDEQQSAWLTNDLQRALKPYIPASTFKVPHSLLLLENEVVKDHHSQFAWDGVKHGYSSWNQDHSFASALRYSVVPIYQQLARELGPERMAAGVNLLNYGNRDISGEIDSFWLQGELAITAVEQIDFLRALYHQTLPLSLRSQAIVKQMMLLPGEGNGTWFGKTGYATRPQQKVGWFVGWYQLPNRVIFFALNMDVDDPHLLPLRQKLVKQALQQRISAL